jgi:hypothetical protein
VPEHIHLLTARANTVALRVDFDITVGRDDGSLAIISQVGRNEKGILVWQVKQWY